ncbi:HK97 family phage prohead protease [Neomegalonema sp.]|uniref:HK97 family phage prohead protease n=1 Tax=Neomegalonema sp. TaxID=2039713 RepID=UPI00260B4967|nr:HK97 family phage prohead protease [Neomegalonema sp.]MDD2870230.1 HK97 family phage prohead protease [Neomegalonema sp.]
MKNKLAWAQGVEIKSDQIDDQTGVFEGYGAIFGARDKGGDVIEPGAFAASLARHRTAGSMPALLLQHDPASPVGVWEIVEEDARGLRVRGRLLLDVQAGREALALLKARALTGLSIGYRTLRSKGGADGVRMLQEVDLWEVSLVTFPMQPLAGVDSVKFSELEAGVDSLAEAEALLREEAGFSRKAARDFVGRILALDRKRREAEADQQALTSAAQRLLTVFQ